MEDTFLLDAGNTTGQGQQLLLLQQQDASLPILDLSDEKDTAAAVGEQNQTSIVGEEDNAGEKVEKNCKNKFGKRQFLFIFTFFFEIKFFSKKIKKFYSTFFPTKNCTIEI